MNRYDIGEIIVDLEQVVLIQTQHNSSLMTKLQQTRPVTPVTTLFYCTRLTSLITNRKWSGRGNAMLRISLYTTTGKRNYRTIGTQVTDFLLKRPPIGRWWCHTA